MTKTFVKEDNVYYKHPAVAIGILTGVLVAFPGLSVVSFASFF